MPPLSPQVPMNNSSDLVVKVLCRGLKLWAGLPALSERGETIICRLEDISSVGGIVPEKSSNVEKVGSAAETSMASGMLLREPGSTRAHQSVVSLEP